MSAFHNKNTKIGLITFLVLTLVAVTAAITWWISLQVNLSQIKPDVATATLNLVNSKKNQTEFFFPANSIDPLMPNDTQWMWRSESKLVDEQTAVKAQPSQGCQQTLEWPSVQVPMDQFNLAFGSKPGDIPELPIEVDAKETCYTEGYGIWIIGIQPTPAGPYSPDAIWSRVIRIEKGSSNQKIKLVTKFLGTPIYHWPSRVLPPFHPHAKIVNREGLQKIVADIDYIIDVRTKQLQKKWPLPFEKVILIPYTANLESLADHDADRTDNRKARHVDLGDQWSEDIWNKWEKNKKILIVGQNPTDSRAFRALTWLSESNFKNLYWFYEGADAFYQPMNEIPIWNTYSPFNWTDHIPHIQQEVSSRQALLIDLRSADDFQRIRHPLAINKPYSEVNVDYIGVLRGLDAMDLYHILKSGDQFDLSDIPLNQKIYLMGSDRYDWRPLKLFVRLKHRSPEQDVRVVRDGIAEFGLWQRINMNLIKLEGTKSSSIH